MKHDNNAFMRQLERSCEIITPEQLERATRILRETGYFGTVDLSVHRTAHMFGLVPEGLVKVNLFFYNLTADGWRFWRNDRSVWYDLLGPEFLPKVHGGPGQKFFDGDVAPEGGLALYCFVDIRNNPAIPDELNKLLYNFRMDLNVVLPPFLRNTFNDTLNECNE